MISFVVMQCTGCAPAFVQAYVADALGPIERQEITSPSQLHQLRDRLMIISTGNDIAF